MNNQALAFLAATAITLSGIAGALVGNHHADGPEKTLEMRYHSCANSAQGTVIEETFVEEEFNQGVYNVKMIGKCTVGKDVYTLSKITSYKKFVTLDYTSTKD